MDKAPDAFRTISEVADELDIPQHVLRFWETRFTQIKPMKRSGGRRFYRPDDVDLLRGIRRLLYAEGYTIRGVQRILKEQGIKAVQAIDAEIRAEAPVAAPQAVSAASRKAKPAKAAIVHEEPAVEDDVDPADELTDPTTIVVTPPLPKPFTTPLPSLELLRNDGQIMGMVPRSAMPPEVERPPKLQPAPTPPSYLPDIAFDTSMPMQRRGPQRGLREEAAKAPPFDIKRLQPVLDELLSVRRMLDAAMQNGDQ